MHAKLTTTTLVLLWFALGAIGPAHAGLEYWDLPMTVDSGTSARALGMGNTYLAVSEDGAALRFNPAGLAQVKRLEFAGALTDVSREIATYYKTTEIEDDNASTRISFAGFTYPFPTYRGSMVIAIGYSAPWIEDRKYQPQYSIDDIDRTEQVLEEGAVGEWSFGYAVDISPTISLGLRASAINGSYYRESRIRAYGEEFFLSSDHDVSGFTGSLGALARVGQHTRLGFVLDLPRWVEWDLYQAEAEDLPSEHYGTEEITYPFSAGFGAAHTIDRLLLVADVRFTDWTQIDFYGPYRYSDNEGTHDLYRRTVDLHFGAEYLLDMPGFGLRLRAGFAQEPVPYAAVKTGIDTYEDEDPYNDEFLYSEASFSPDRRYWTAGVGLLIEESLTVDLAYAAGAFTREGDRIGDEQKDRRLVLTAAFRMD